MRIGDELPREPATTLKRTFHLPILTIFASILACGSCNGWSSGRLAIAHLPPRSLGHCTQNSSSQRVWGKYNTEAAALSGAKPKRLPDVVIVVTDVDGDDEVTKFDLVSKIGHCRRSTETKPL